MSENILCIYHKDCVDGTAAAAVFLRKFPNAQCIPLSHNYLKETVDDIIASTSKDFGVYIVDCTLGINEFLKNGNKVTVIDHHVGSNTEMKERASTEDRLTYVFDNDRSGATLTWSHFFSDEPIPEMLMYVEDSDLWKGKYGNVTKDVTRYLSMFLNEPAYILSLIEGNIEDIKEKGEVLSSYADASIARHIETPPLSLHYNEHSFLAFNITEHESACGNILSQRHDATVALFTIKGDSVKLSFRSLSHHEPSALSLAQSMGGGGHRNAAGATVSLSVFLEMVVRDNE